MRKFAANVENDFNILSYKSFIFIFLTIEKKRYENKKNMLKHYPNFISSN